MNMKKECICILLVAAWAFVFMLAHDLCRFGGHFPWARERGCTLAGLTASTFDTPANHSSAPTAALHQSWLLPDVLFLALQAWLLALLDSPLPLQLAA